MKPDSGPLLEDVRGAMDASGVPLSQEPWTGDVLLMPKWVEQVARSAGSRTGAPEEVALITMCALDAGPWMSVLPEATAFLMSTSDTVETWKARLNEGTEGVRRHVIWVLPTGAAESVSGGEADGAAGAFVLCGFRLVKALLTKGWGRRPLGLTVVTRDAGAVSKVDRVDPTQAAVHGLIGSLSRECPAWQCRLVDLPSGESIGPEVVARVLGHAVLPNGGASVWRDGHWYERKLLRCQVPGGQAGGYRAGGVYVMLGGAGGLGRVLSRHLIERYQAKVIWIGRRQQDETITRHIQELAQPGGIGPEYVSADAGDLIALAGARERIVAKHGAIHGVLHATIVLEDRMLAWMDEDAFTRVWDAKARTSDCMWRVFRRDDLDWFMFFSSMQSFAKGAGQSNYAAGCAYTDALAERMRTETETPVKVINWGYWGEVGVVATEAYSRLMAIVGLGSIEPASAMAVLESTLSSPLRQVVFARTTRSGLLPDLGAIDGLSCKLMEKAVVALPSEGAPRAAVPMQDAVRLGASRSARIASLIPGLLAVQLREAGLLGEEGVSSLKLADRAASLPEHLRKWVAESLGILARHGLVRQHEGGWLMAPAQWSDALESAKAWAQFKADAREAAGACEAEITLVEATLKSIPAVLQGRENASSVLFPRGSMALVENIYRNNPVADHFNGLLADKLLNTIEAQLRADPDAKLRLLEIGAGTGGTSAVLFDRLAPVASSIDEYAYTDLSQLFLIHAKERFGHLPYLKRRIFNVEKPVLPQGHEPGSYDIVIAANVLHATRHIGQTLGNAKALLKRGGLLLINELASNSVFMHVTFGLLEGWWLYEDPAVRIPGCPVLSPMNWEHVLRNEGFTHVCHAVADATMWGQQVIAASSDGLVCQAEVAVRH